ncbi:MAG: hypothetical protein LQ345_004513 [Seirophora villosa]|nr:MAG: hypothetical protein LQ345_004513 [Seirophora villosa]
MEVLNAAPTEGNFTPLSTHQSQTPSSFYTGPPVLHHHSPSATLLISSSDLKNNAAFTNFAPPSEGQSNGSMQGPVNGTGDVEDREVSIEGVDVWVTSEKFLLFSRTRSTGVSIPYPSISLHAIQRAPEPSLILQLLSSPGPQFDDHDPDATLSLTIIPATSSSPQHAQPNTGGTTQQQASTTAPTPLSLEPSLDEEEEEANPSSPPTAPSDPITQLFSALSACADLHPDPASPSDIDISDDHNPDYLPRRNADDTDALYTQIDGLPPPMPGSGGWITAENVGEFFDGDGNFRGAGPLGQGAGSI